ncbi:MAG: hypothetical protein ABI580_08050 [Burkholderiaceae bacterium]
MAVTAKLKIILQANEIVVAESEDELLWRRVLTAIQGGSPPLDDRAAADGNDVEDVVNNAPPKGGVEKFAKALGVTTAALVGACEPTREPPYLVLDAKSWEAFKKNTPPRGLNSVAGLQLAGTLLCVWFKHGGITGRPTQAQALAVLGSIGVTDKNPSRSIKNCTWLQSRPDGIQINPAETSKAERVAKAFVQKATPSFEE